MKHRSPVEHIDQMIKRYYGRSFSYYWWRTGWVTSLMMVALAAFVVAAGAWWLWLAFLCLNVPTFFLNFRAARGAWRAMQEAGPSLAALDALLERMRAGE